MADHILHDKACKAAKPKAKVYYKRDGNGLRLQIRPDGAKYWMLRYTRGGKESTHGLGRYGDVGLEEARTKAAAARKLVAEGISPTIARRVHKAQNVEKGEATFEVVANEWLGRNKTEWSGHHYERNEGLLRRILYPDLGALPVSSITEPMLLGVLKDAYDSGIKESARRARAVAQQVFGYAKDTHRATHNPARELAGSSVLAKPKVTPFAALKPKQVGAFLRKLAASGTERTTRTALLLLLYTGLRDASLRGARWKEIDLKAATWTVPASRMKSDREHRLPLPKQAVALLKELAKSTRTTPNDFVFASYGKGGFLAENTLRIALHRLEYKVTAHGFRSLLTDLLNERGFNADAVERQLDHVERGARKSYLRTDFFEQRKVMMQWVADWADAQRDRRAEPAIPGNVVPLRRAG